MCHGEQAEANPWAADAPVEHGRGLVTSRNRCAQAQCDSYGLYVTRTFGDTHGTQPQTRWLASADRVGLPYAGTLW